MKITTLPAMLILALAAAGCTESSSYPTQTFERMRADGTPVTTYGAYSETICETIAKAACDSQSCETTFIGHCVCSSSGIVETPSLDSWNETWGACFEGIDQLYSDYKGNRPIAGCERLTPFWAGS